MSLGSLIDDLVARIAALEKQVGLSSGAAPAPAASSAPAGPSPLVAAFDTLIQTHVAPLVDVCNKMGGDAPKLGKAVEDNYKIIRQVLDVASNCKKPSNERLNQFGAEMSKAMAPVLDVSRNRDSPFVNHAKAVEGAATAFRWVITFPGAGMTPVTMVEAGLEAGEYNANLVRRASKEKNVPEWMTFANQLRDGLKATLAFIGEQNLKGGISFNGRGKDVDEYLSAAPAAPAPAATAAPAPAAPTAAPAPASEAKDGAAMQSQLFAQLRSIDQSSGKTAGLRHVTKDMKAAPAASSAAPVAPAAPAAPTPRSSGPAKFPTGAPVCKLVDNRWKVEFQSDNMGSPLRLDKADLKHEVYIYGCRNALIYVDSKCKAVKLDTCYNTTVVLEACLSGIEVVNSQKIKMQVTKSVPSVAIDKTDGILVGLPFASRGASFVTSKSSEMNVTFPVSEKEDADWTEQPIPEQFVTTITDDNKTVTRVSDLYSA